METAQERELHGWQSWWPLDTMACSLDTSTGSSFVFEWEPQLSYFDRGLGVGAGDPDTHERERELELLVPKGMESTVVTGLPTAQDATAMPKELDELLQSLWDSDEEKAVGFSSCSGLKEASDISFQHDDHFVLSSVSPTSPEKALTQPQAELPSPSSHCSVEPRGSDNGGAQRQTVRANCFSKRSALEEKEPDCSGSCKRSRKAPSSTAGGAGPVVHPFTVVKPGGVEGIVTLADINKWIHTPPARPVRHPVGEFACAPRASAGNRPAPSGKTVAGFTRLHTAGRGTITIVRTRG